MKRWTLLHITITVYLTINSNFSFWDWCQLQCIRTLNNHKWYHITISPFSWWTKKCDNSTYFNWFFFGYKLLCFKTIKTKTLKYVQLTEFVKISMIKDIFTNHVQIKNLTNSKTITNMYKKPSCHFILICL